MQTKLPGKVTITAEATSPEALERILEQAIFELKLSSVDPHGFEPQPLSKSANGNQSGTLGSYTFEFIAPAAAQ